MDEKEDPNHLSVLSWRAVAGRGGPRHSVDEVIWWHLVKRIADFVNFDVKRRSAA